MSLGLVPLPPRDLAWVIALGIAQALVLGGWIVCTWQAVDAIAGMQQDIAAVYPWLAGLLAVSLCMGGLRALEFRVCERIGFDAVRRLRMQLYRHMVGMAPRQIQHRSRGSLLLRLTGDLTMYRTLLSRGIARGIASAIVLVIGLAVVAWISGPMAVAAILVFGLGAAASVSQGRLLRRATAVVRRRRSLLTGNIDEQVNTLAVVQTFGRVGGETSRLSHQNDSMTKALNREAAIRGRMRGISAATGWAAVMVALAAGAYEMSEGYLTLAGLAAAATCVRHLASPARNLALVHDYWRRADISRRKIRDFLNSRSRPLDELGHMPVRVRAGMIQFDRVSVKGALSGVSGTIPGRKRVAIVGPSGAGKSTLLGLVARLVEPDQGEVLVDGIVLSSATLHTSTRDIGIVSADLPLMRGTLRRNLTYRHRSASDEELASVLTACGLDGLVGSLPQGLDSWLTEGGRNLSAGERQRVALARAMLRFPRILLLDEPTTNLDRESAAIFHAAIDRYPGTVLIATHDPAEVALTDMTWELCDGRLVRVGPSEDRHDPGPLRAQDMVGTLQ
ncbi:ABC transporter ATP-binding protein/permease [Tsuneonella sp. YG55]|uniref:ABC transporter ATP-binding protein/permease n=1 Tax=Tsuneonella litorea TaxID=2976475 RepID=A0A9X2W2G1_9SPHN|nr:ABC transporter ATP-binding protein [Tsuneonella litorea]MCT2559349.1 ABC transporter ATP-binding protein/permease [Tsuneonella litorea]